MLQAVPKDWFSWDFTVVRGSQTIADIDMSSWGEKATLTVEGANYQVYREGLMSGDFILKSPDAVVARASKPSAFHRSFLIEHAGKQYELRAESAFRRGLLFVDGERAVGSVSPEGAFTRRAAVDLPDALPLPLQVFVVWLAVILWKRAAAAAS